MKLKYQFVVREVAGSVMAVAVGPDSEKFNGLIKLNSVARTIFEALCEDTTEDRITARILDEYDVTEENAARSVSEFIGKLRDEGLIVD